MKKLILATVAGAALTMAAGAASAADPTDWTGVYIGVSAGLADRNESGGETILFDTNLDGNYGDTVNTAAGANAFSPGFCGGSFNTNAAGGGCRKDDDTDTEIGVRLGYDHQIMGNFVIGALVEYNQLELQDAVTAFSTTPASYNFTRKLTSTFAVRARAGYAVDNLLIYATGGYAVGNMRHSFRTTNGVNAFPVSGGGDAKGYQLGFGAEYRIMPNVSIGVEAIRTSLEDDDFTTRASNSGTTAATNPFLLVNTAGTDFLRSDDDFEYNSIRATLSYRF
ncbi:outer membrane beta-barrel protein [uncultured Phenylobacterium sp.]|uniref:outer membrane protein n=1 Tax=uncultured Phenylobacterium sp. TaxID=349273 RepID=UPI0025CE0757|nr:outer membrane beta-barrel protein [uncultured Phenylobacterium sp.]